MSSVLDKIPQNMRAPTLFISANTPKGQAAFRDIRAYLEHRARLNGDPHFLVVFSRTINACGLDPTGRQTGDDLKGNELARVAIVLAAALVRSARTNELQRLYQRLQSLQGAELLRELRTIMWQADEIEIPRFRLTMRGFGSAGEQMEGHAKAVVRAYEAVGTLLQRADAGFIRPCINRYNWMLGKSVAPKVKHAFHRYFGKLDATVETSKLEFSANIPSGARTQQHAWVVANVLERMRSAYFSKATDRGIQIIYGKGDKMNLLDFATTPLEAGLPSKTPVVCINGSTFSLLTSDGLVHTLAHELSHAWAYCGDHGYREKCFELAKTSPGEALTNADSYAYFIAEAFQFGRKTIEYGARMEREACGYSAMKR